MKELICLMLLLSCGTMYAQKIITATYSEKEKTLAFDKKSVSGKESFAVKIAGLNNCIHETVFSFEDYELFSEAPPVIGTVLPGIIGSFEMNRNLDLSKDVSASFSNSDYIDLYKRLDIILNSLTVFRNSCNECNNNTVSNAQDLLKVFKGLYNNASMNADELFSHVLKDIDYAIVYYESLQAVNNNAIDDHIARLLASLAGYYNSVKNNKIKLLNGVNQCIVIANGLPVNDQMSDIHKPNKEIVSVNIYMLDKFNMEDTIAKFREEIFRKHLFKIDFSTGLTGNNLTDSKYYFSGSNLTRTIEEEKTNKCDIGVTGLLHVNWKMTPCLSFGPVTGVSVSLLDGKAKYLLGGGISIGKYKSVSISGGAVWGQVAELSKLVSTDGKNVDKVIPASLEEVPMNDSLKTGFFISATYNLTRVKK